MSLLSALLITLGSAQAEPIGSPIPERFQIQALPHGPDGPLPDDGYEFKDGGGSGNLLAKLGLVCIVAGGVTGVMALRAETGSVERNDYSKATAGLLGSGVGLIVLERVF
ncbi:MAG: hypothetical protein VX278_20385 [Myxococcota bacterium]|nr:hypothetical protein [Myxococcota bacterium]